MQCNKCGFYNPQGMDFCGRCATKLNHVCPNCHLANPIYSKTCSQCGHKLSDTFSSHSRKAAQHDNAERRQLTILFCDIVNSSAISAKIDPEDLRDIIREYRTTCSKVIARHDGYIAQHLGDGILVYFGYPRAHEDDARRAVHAGLKIIQNISEFHFQIDQNTCIQLAVRIGIHTGLVVVGEIGDDDKRTLALGETPNIAARIQNHANENTLVVSSTTQQLLGQEFTSHSLGCPSLKGFSQHLELFRVDEFCRATDRMPEPHNDNNVPLIGREKETALLLKKVEQAQNGTGQIVLLHGEPGLGKSRIVQFVCDNSSLNKYILLECTGIPFFQHSFFHPVLQLIQRMIGITKNMDENEKIFKIEQASTDLGLDPEITTPILADLLSLPLNKQYLINIESTPKQKKQLAIDVFLKILRSLTKKNFVLFIVEDIQWIDPSTHELLTQITHQEGLRNIFTLFTSRNDFSIPVPMRDYITQITLNHLDKQESGRLIQYLCDNKPLPKELFEKIVAKTDGVPFFIEEVTNSLLHSDSLIEKEDHYELSVPLARLEIPVTLNDSLASKLDNLGENKKLAQLCSILGREFYYELLSAVCEYKEDFLHTCMNGLIKTNIIYQQDISPLLQYSFRHALIQDAAYQSLLKRTRQKYHGKIATILKDQFPIIVSDNPELIAYHHTMAGDYEESLIYWLKAGRYAARRSANVEAISHFSNGLEALTKLPYTKHLRNQELTFQTELGQSIIQHKGYAAPEVKHAYNRAWTLCDDIDDINIIFPVLTGLWEYNIARAEIDIALELASKIQSIAMNSDNEERNREAERILGTTHFWRGEFSEALLHLQKHTSYRIGVKTLGLPPYYQETNVATLANASCAIWLAGNPDEALKQAQNALYLAKQLSHPFSQAYALQFLMTIHQLNGDYETVTQYANTQISLSRTYCFPFWTATGKMMRAWADACSQPDKYHITSFRDALRDYEATGSKLARSYFYTLYAEMLNFSGNISEAKDILENAIEDAKLSGEKYFIAEMLRIKGILLFNHSDYKESKKAERTLNRATELAQKQGAKSLSLRIANSLTLLRGKNNHN